MLRLRTFLNLSCSTSGKSHNGQYVSERWTRGGTFHGLMSMRTTQNCYSSAGKNKLMNINFLAISFFLFTFMVACSNGQPKNIKESGSILNPIDACKWLTATDAEMLLGSKVGECKTIISYTSDGNKNATSQVAYYSEPNQSKSVSLMVKRNSSASNPSSKMEYAEQEKTADAMGTGTDIFNAIKQGQDVSGLGDVAFTYEMFGHNLMVFWKGNYLMIISVYGTENDNILKMQKSVASKVIKDL